MERLPARFGRYVLESRVGQGGMAEVFRARIDDGFFQKTVCIKRILPELSKASGFADMLRDEARLAGRFTHANLVQTIDFGEIAGALYIAMELVDGVSLADVNKYLRFAGEPFPVPLALHVAACMCRGLHHAHSASDDGRPLRFVHRDVSPQNVLLGKDGAAKISDFGIASAQNRLTHTETGAIKGKPQYMAPEQVDGGACDHRLDQFATGIVLWEMLAGRGLFRQPSVLLILDAVCRCDIPALESVRDDISPALASIVRRALAAKPAERFADMAAFEVALNAESARMGASAEDLDLRPLVARAAAFKDAGRETDEARAARGQIGHDADIGDEGKTEVDVPASAAVSASAPTAQQRPRASSASSPSGRGATPATPAAAPPTSAQVERPGWLAGAPSTSVARAGPLARVRRGRVLVAAAAVALALFAVVEVVLASSGRAVDTAPHHTTMPQTQAALNTANDALAHGDASTAVTALAVYSSLPEPEVHRTLARAYESLGEDELAKTHARRALELAPEMRDADVRKLADR